MNLAQLKLTSHKDVKPRFYFTTTHPVKEFRRVFFKCATQFRNLIGGLSSAVMRSQDVKRARVNRRADFAACAFYRPEKLAELIKQNKAGKLPVKVTWFGFIRCKIGAKS